jgi:hypothetical protein
MQTNRVIRCVRNIPGERINVGQDYNFSIDNGKVLYKTTVVSLPRARWSDLFGEYMSEAAFKRALKRGDIVFVDNLTTIQGA